MQTVKTLARPTKEDIARLPVFEGLPLERIHLVETPSQVRFASRQIAQSRFIGFDTESKPTFVKEAIQDGPHVIQFATLDHAFIVRVGSDTPVAFLTDVIESEEVVKVGFGLKSDQRPIRHKLDLRLRAAVDLAQVIRESGYRQAVGAKVAVAIVLGRRLVKSRKITTSNWASPNLSDRQLLYAANDAYAALAVFHALGMPSASLEAAEPAS